MMCFNSLWTTVELYGTNHCDLSVALLLSSSSSSLFLYYQTNSSWSSSSIVCAQIRVVVTKRTSPSCPCVAGRGTLCAAMTVLWSSPTCCQESRGIRSCCRTAAERRSCPHRSAQRRSSCILSADEFTTPAQSEEVASAWSGRPWPSSSARSLFMLQDTASQDSLHTFSGEERSTHWLMSLQDASPLRRRAADRRMSWDNDQNWSKVCLRF